jgi:hypothetical protein
MRVVDQIYNTNAELDKILNDFSKEYAPKGEHRLALQDIKINLHHETHKKLVNGGMSLLEI